MRVKTYGESGDGLAVEESVRRRLGQTSSQREGGSGGKVELRSRDGESVVTYMVVNEETGVTSLRSHPGICSITDVPTKG